MIESSDPGQASIVFLGRESFRMQVVGTPAIAGSGGAIPSEVWEGKTVRIIERRNSDRDRRKPRRAEPVVESPALTPARNTVIGIALMTFACGVMVATAVNRFPGRTRAAQPVASLAAPQAQPQPAQPPAPTPVPAIVVRPSPKPEPLLEAAAAVVSPPANEPQPEKRMVAAKVKPAPAPAPAPARHAAQAPALRAPKPTPQPAARPIEPAPFNQAAPATAPRPTRRWVDPFAE
ncbi:MAG TPA: hypothetical protein VN903_00240 [Polyangia bacterium]|nr:hypothetical protein [Polyangia bacterium]